MRLYCVCRHDWPFRLVNKPYLVWFVIGALCCPGDTRNTVANIYCSAEHYYIQWLHHGPVLYRDPGPTCIHMIPKSNYFRRNMSTIRLASGNLGEKFWTIPSIPFQPAWQPTIDCNSGLRVKYTDDICHLGWSQQCIRSDWHAEPSGAFFVLNFPSFIHRGSLNQTKLVGSLPNSFTP